ncbi:hypothetical protein [Geofilum rubicundum]|uniref:hypothetical protein n=1 Tax=Geofilum rubicundum TaxID=472113 RepID=UPI000783D570|nr:hypothetical protein [Geofilum rubicundum]
MNKITFIILTIQISSCGFVPEPHSVPLQYEEAEKLLNDFKTYGKIYEMDDCSRSQKYLNGYAIRMEKKLDSSKYVVFFPDDSNAVVPSRLNDYPEYYMEILSQHDIDSSKFHDFRDRLEKTKLRTYENVDSFSIFIVDGFLDGIWGFFHVTDTTLVPSEQFNIGDHTISYKERVKGNWYKFGGS